MQSLEAILNELSAIEKQQVLSVLNEMNSGKSTTYDELMSDIWDEQPVSIDTFIDDERYMRNYFYPDGKSCIVYPRWRQELKDVFKDPYKYSEICFTGGIGLGKSEAAKVGVAYLAYRLMCLKNPQSFYNKPIGKPIVVLFFNNTKELAEKVLLQPFIDMLITSPWFLERGKLVGREHIRYIPDKNIRFEAGSRDSHAIGQDIFCLHGDTEILTEKGYIPIKLLKNSNVKVFTRSDAGDILLSDNVNVIETKRVSELIEIELEDNTIIKCTPEHKLLLKSGYYKQAKELTLDDELEDITKFNVCGIYKITNVMNQKSYVGLSTNIFNRWQQHIKGGTSVALQRAINKHGISNFKFEILEICDESVLSDRERFWITKLQTHKMGYNLSNGGELTLGFRLNDESYEKIANSRKGRIGIHKDSDLKYIQLDELDKYLLSGWSKGLPEYMKKKIGRKGRIFSEETRQKMSNSAKGKILSEETKQKISESLKAQDMNTFAKLTPEQQTEYRRKISESAKHRNKDNYRQAWDNVSKRNKNSIWITNGTDDKFIIKSNLKQYPGWTIGRSTVNNSSKKDLVWVNKDSKNKQIKKDELDLYLNDGYVKGMFKIYKNERYNDNEN